MKKLLMLLLMLPTMAVAQDEVGQIAINYDLDSDSDIACVTKGIRGDPYSGPMQGNSTIQTTGSSTDVTESVSGANPFAGMAADDVLLVTRPDGSVDVRVIVTWTDDSNVVVDTAVDWSGGFAFRWYDTVCGTAASNGWFDVSGFDGGANIELRYEQGDLGTGIDVQWQCRTASVGALANVVYPGESSNCGPGTLSTDHCTFATASIGIATRFALIISEDEPWSSCRVLINRNGADTSDATTNREQVYIVVMGRRK